MLKSVFISGLNGNMGTRYALICAQELGLKVYGMDADHSFSQQATFVRDNNVDGVIIATPTNTHLDAIQIFNAYKTGVPILCEKPILKAALEWDQQFNVRMVNQYKYLVDSDTIGKTSYNFYKTGNDGLLWDCINIVGLANTDVNIKADSPRWKCTINGQKLQLADMEQAYIDMIADWVKDPTPNIDYINMAHKKVVEILESRKKKDSRVSMGSTVTPILSKSNG